LNWDTTLGFEIVNDGVLTIFTDTCDVDFGTEAVCTDICDVDFGMEADIISNNRRVRVSWLEGTELAKEVNGGKRAQNVEAQVRVCGM